MPGQWENFRPPGGPNHSISGGLVASAVAQPAPSGCIIRLSGTAALSTLALPYPGFEGVLYCIGTAAFTGVTGGVNSGLNKPIGKAFTAVVGQAFIMVYCKETEMWHPSI